LNLYLLTRCSDFRFLRFFSVFPVECWKSALNRPQLLPVKFFFPTFHNHLTVSLDCGLEILSLNNLRFGFSSKWLIFCLYLDCGLEGGYQHFKGTCCLHLQVMVTTYQTTWCLNPETTIQIFASWKTHIWVVVELIG
jgi:hypothetical protein